MSSVCRESGIATNGWPHRRKTVTVIFFSISSGFQAMADVAQKLDSALGTTGETIIVEGVK
jgi:hypothetical protein